MRCSDAENVTLTLRGIPARLLEKLEWCGRFFGESGQQTAARLAEASLRDFTKPTWNPMVAEHLTDEQLDEAIDELVTEREVRAEIAAECEAEEVLSFEYETDSQNAKLANGWDQNGW